MQFENVSNVCNAINAKNNEAYSLTLKIAFQEPKTRNWRKKLILP